MGRKPTEQDIREVYRATVDDLFDMVARRCRGNRELAEDIVQETWLRAVDAWRAEGLPDRPAAWLARVAIRLLSNYRRHELVERIGDEDPDVLPAADDAGGESNKRRSLLQRALDRLPFAQSRMLEAFHFEDQRVAEIAAASGLSERAVEGRLRRARLRLRHLIESDRQRGDDL